MSPLLLPDLVALPRQYAVVGSIEARRAVLRCSLMLGVGKSGRGRGCDRFVEREEKRVKARRKRKGRLENKSADRIRTPGP